MAKESEQVTFVVAGQLLSAGRAAAPSGGRIKAGVRVGARRGGTDVVRLTAQPGDDIVLLHIANGPTLYLHPEDARELLRSQADAAPSTSRGTSQLPSANGDVYVPAQLRWRGLDDGAEVSATRGKITNWIGDVALDAIEIVTGLFKDKAAKIAAAEVTRRLDGQVDAGVYRLMADSLEPLKGSSKVAKIPATQDPILVLMHGTFVDTASTFGKLWAQHPARVEQLFARYGGHVYALDHETVGVSPFGNALTLVRALPKGAHLHVVTHSRGGIVAEALARVCGGQGLQDEDLALFAGERYEKHRRELTELAREVSAKKIKVDRVVRIACPARGTLLASRRLDAYLSVLKWTLELSGTVVLPQLVDFLAEVARRRTDPEELPGLEAMMPGRPVAKWLNAPADPINGELRVVAGDIEGDSVLTWLKTLLSDAFYWTDNDLVVQTRSMYGGTPRADGAASFALDRGGKVTHFNYFANERTADLITRALLDAQPEHFLPIGPLSWAGEDASGTRAGRAAASSRAGNVAERPAVFVLPGILGSHLKVNGKRVWLSARFISNLERLEWHAGKPDKVAPDGPVGMSYDDLIEHLADTHEVIPFSFDWRRPIQEEARRLAAAVDDALVVRQATQQPVRIVAHSMGGLVVRTMRLEKPDTWQRWMARPGARFVMLGTPNGGSFAPMQVLSGDDTFGNLFTMFGGLFDGPDARQWVAGMPGLLQLQADLTGTPLALDTVAGWQALADADLKKIKERVAQRAFWHRDHAQIEAMKWGVPNDAIIDFAVQLRRRLDEQRDFGVDAKNVVLVVGKAKSTPAGVKINENGNVVYLDTPDGDGRVTLANALLPGVKTWQVDAVHGDLANTKKAFDGYVDLLVSGTTTQLSTLSATGAVRGAVVDTPAAILTPSRPARSMTGAAPPADMDDVFGGQAAPAPSGAIDMRVQIRIVNGNLKFVRQPLLLGHYRSLKLTGTEYVIDQLLGSTMSESLKAGLYPSTVGTQQVFVNSRPDVSNPYALPRPEAAIVVGLGEEGELRLSGLIESIQQGVIAYAQRLAEHGDGAPTTFALAATLIGSGGQAISPGTSAQAVALGVRQANRALAEAKWPRVAQLELIELYGDRASEALSALTALATDRAPDMIIDRRIVSGQGGLPRPVAVGYRGADYDFISIQQRIVADGTELAFTLNTKRARDEVRGTVAQSKLVDQLVCAGANDLNDDPRIGRTLFKLLMPLEIEPFLAGSRALQLQLDRNTAAYPWEMLDLPRGGSEGGAGSMPWSIQARLLRKLRTDEFRAHPRTAESAAGVLIIGEPKCPPDYARLPGAVAEATAVAEVFDVQPILDAEAKEIANEIYDRSYAILHVAGHGDFNKKDGDGGVVLSDGILFGAREVNKMRLVPQLAFINCCHLGRFANDAGKPAKTLTGGLPKFAANVAEELIKIGVHCVIAAGWAVQDDAAKLFARTFYESLLNGRSFIDAVGNARTATYQKYPDDNTWAAYQCYGDPDWTF
ncbi:MAG: CHAT domain-containing protein, partial [Steroidobacteraceae bacterium]